MNIPTSPESYFTRYIPERFSAMPGFEQVSSAGSVAFAVPEVGLWSFRLRAGQLLCEPALASDPVVRITIPAASFEPIVVRGTERMAGLALSPEKQMLAFRALTLDAERSAQIRSVVGSVVTVMVFLRTSCTPMLLRVGACRVPHPRSRATG